MAGIFLRLTQFCLVLYAFMTLSPMLMIGGVTWIFLADLGVRDISAEHFLLYFTVDTVPVIFTSLAICSINIAIPSLAGEIIVLKDRWS